MLAILVEAGDHVKKGQPLARLDTAVIAPQVASLRAALEHARAAAVLGESLAVFKEAGNQRGVADALSVLGLVEDYQGHHERAEEIGAALIDDFAAGEIDELVCAYTDFRSAFTLRATSKRFLPIAAAEVAGSGPKVVHPEYLFEPAPAEILDHLLPQYLVTKVYAALLESAASENASRRRAMKAATDNAEELIKILTRQANRARQDEITTEIMEIVGGAEALAAEAEG